MSNILLFQKTRTLSAVLVSVAICISLVFSFAFGIESASWQVWLAVIALAVGIPHGALDHLVTVPRMQPTRLALFVAGYLGVTILAALAIFRWPTAGFIFVVLMSAVHFGMGDASFVIQATENRTDQKMAWWIYALPAGTLPVIVPLTNNASMEALTLVNPILTNWHGGFNQIFFWLTIAVAISSIIYLLINKRIVDARDLIILGALALLTPPLVSFAVFFGLWHALRHTARLSLELGSARAKASGGHWVAALWKVTVPGLPALAGTMVLAGAIVAIGGWGISQYLWSALVLVWALTVPHMALTWRLDKKVLLDDNNKVSTGI